MKRNKLTSKAEAITVTSVKEGWGLIVTEANALGTPAIVYDVDGLRDSVKDKDTELIVKGNTPFGLSNVIVKFLEDEKMKSKLSRNALEYSKEFRWGKSAKESLKAMESVKQHD